MTPLPLNSLDRLFLAQEYPGVTLASHVFLELERPLLKSTLLHAISDVGRARPELGCRIVKGWLHQKRVPVAGWPDANAVLYWQDTEFNSADPELDRVFRLDAEPAFRITHAPSAQGRAVVVFSAHHALMDGIGQVNLLHQILSAYASRLTGQPYTPSAPPPIRLRGLLFKRFGIWGTIRRALLGFSPIKPFREKNASLLETDTGAPSAIRERLITLNATQDQRIQEFGRKNRITRHSAILTHLLRTCDRWQIENRREERPFRIMHPVNIRPVIGAHPEQLQNFVGSIESRFTPAEIRDENFPKQMGQHMASLKDADKLLENIFHLGLLATLLPFRWLKREMRSFDLGLRNFYYSLLFTHVVVPEWPALGENRVRATWGRGSLTRQPGIGVALATGQGTRLCFYAHSKSFSEAALNRIISLFEEAIETG